MSELKACECGYTKPFLSHAPNNQWQGICPGCGTRSRLRRDREAAIAAWNRRATPEVTRVWIAEADGSIRSLLPSVTREEAKKLVREVRNSWVTVDEAADAILDLLRRKGVVG